MVRSSLSAGTSRGTTQDIGGSLDKRKKTMHNMDKNDGDYRHDDDDDNHGDDRDDE